MPRKIGNEIRLPGTTGIDNLPIPLIMTINKYYWSQNLKLYSSTCAIYKTFDPLTVYIIIYIYNCVYICIYIYIYILCI